METIYKPSKDPDKRVCVFCKKEDATRWDGGFQFHTVRDGKLVPVIGPQYCCIDCDTRHKWFDLDEEDYETETN